MTEQHSLKKQIRERMSRTGESYTAAHRHILATQPRAPHADAVAGYPAFGASEHAPSGLSRHLLAASGIELSEPMAFGLGGGIGFLYAVFEYREVPHPLLTIVAQHHPQPWLEAVASNLAIGLSTVTSASPGLALKKLDAALEQDRPAQLTVGRGLLPWHKDVRLEESADPYPIVVAGRSRETYLLDDADPEPRFLSADELAAAWAAQRKGRFSLTTVQRTETAVSIADAIRAAITMTASHLTGPVLGNAFDVNIGLSGIGRLLADLEDTTTKKGWIRRFGTPDAFAIGMARLAECLTWAYTSPGAGRPLYGRFLEEAATASGLPLEKAAENARDAGARWVAIADLAAEPEAPETTIPELAHRVRGVLDVERRLAAELGSAVSNG